MAPLTLQNCCKNQHFFNISAFWPHQARAYMHHACHLMSRGPFFFLFLISRWLFLPKPPFSTSVLHYWNALAPFDSYKNTFRTNGFSTFLFWPHQAHAYMHHTCHLMSRSSSFFFLPAVWSLFPPKITPTRSRVRSLGVLGPLLTLQRKPLKTNTFSTFPLFGLVKPTHDSKVTPK